MTGNVHSISSPIKGWNVRDSIDSLDEMEAVRLDNWFPDSGKCTIRKGYESYATSMTSNVETLMEFYAQTHNFFIAAANNKIWDISSTGAASDVTNGATITSNRWQWAQFDDASGGPRIGLVNGADTPLQIYVSASSPIVTSLTVSASGLTAANVIGINVYKNRTYFWEDNSQDFWYSSTNALGGAMTKFPLGRVTGFGGNIMSMATWTVDAGDGVNDIAVFLMDTGDVILYEGDDPGASNWGLIGIFKTGEIISRRCWVDVGSDLLITTKEGYVSMNDIFKPLDRRNSPLSKIDPEVRSKAASYGSNFGWQLVYYSKGNRVLFNVPISSSETQQHVFNTQTKAWCRFTGMKAYCWGTYNGDLYFGGAGGVVYKADTGYTDGGSAIVADAITAPNYLGSQGRQKQITAAQNSFQIQGSSLAYGVTVAADFKIPDVPIVSGVGNASSTPWGSAWGSDWSSKFDYISEWESVEAIGYNFSVRLKASTQTQEINWFRTNLMHKTGSFV